MLMLNLNCKINEIKNKISYINILATTNALTVVENKLPNVSNTKVSEIENKITTDHGH